MAAEITRYDTRRAMLLCIYGLQAQVRPVRCSDRQTQPCDIFRPSCVLLYTFKCKTKGNGAECVGGT